MLLEGLLEHRDRCEVAQERRQPTDHFRASTQVLQYWLSGWSDAEFVLVCQGVPYLLREAKLRRWSHFQQKSSHLFRSQRQKEQTHSLFLVQLLGTHKNLHCSFKETDELEVSFEDSLPLGALL